MKNRRLILTTITLATGVLLIAVFSVFAQEADQDQSKPTFELDLDQRQTAFIYQGQLREGDLPVTGTYDFRFTLYTAQTGGDEVSSIVSESLVLTNGLFKVELDFDRAASDAHESWLEVAVRSASGMDTYIVLSPRQKLTPTPYAIFAQQERWSLIGVPVGVAGHVDKDIMITGKTADDDVTGAEISADQVMKGTRPRSEPGRVNDRGDNSSPALSPSGVDGDWTLTGNAGTNPNTHFLGTTDNMPLVLQTNRTERMRVMETGLVGIGTTGPLAGLHVNVRQIPSTGIASHAQLTLETAGLIGGRALDLIAGAFNNISAIDFSSESPGLEFRTKPYAMRGSNPGVIAGTEIPTLMTIRTNGNVGIGTTNPGARLEVNSGSADVPPIVSISTPNAADFVSIFGGRQNFQSPYIAWRRGPLLFATATSFGGSGLSEKMRITETGNIGIGTTNPMGPLHIVRTGTPPAGLSTADNGLLLGIESTSGYKWIQSYGGVLALNPQGNNVGIGTRTAPSRLSVAENAEVMSLTNAGRARFGAANGGSVELFHPNGNRHIELVANETSLSNSGGGLINVTNGGGNTTIRLNGGSGRVMTSVLEITGGSDLAEPFEVSEAEAITPGMVVAIDPKQPGRLRLADKAYDRTVAGIVSGANGINPGLTMKQQGTVADGSLPVALTGRVYCWADASSEPITPGDLLTTSDMPGHAMKVKDHKKAQGAIIGKAMSALKEGRGIVLVLVTLQ